MSDHLPVDATTAVAPLHLSLFGGLSVRLNQAPVTNLASTKASALLAYLAVTKRAHAREVLADLLWDDRTTEQAAGNLRVLLSSLRKQVGDYLVISRDEVTFNQDSEYWLDTDAFSRTIAQAEQGAEAIAALEAAVALYHGEFLAGFYIRESVEFEAWASRQRDHFHHLAITALRRLAQHYLTQGRYEQGIVYAKRLLGLDPLLEEGHQLLMWLLARSGQRTAALRQYEQCRTLLHEELGVEPSEATAQLYERLRTARLIGTHNLPTPTGTFVGRETTRADLQQKLADPSCRLLTLLGLGGVGKTRLALDCATHIITHQSGMFLDGIGFVCLAAVESAALVPTAMARALNVPLQGRSSANDQLLAALRDREMLLILDNVEQLLGTNELAQWISDLLQAAPHLTLLVTSRERLHLHEEQIFDLTGLAYVRPHAVPEQPLSAYAAHRLFVERVRAVRHTFTPDEERWQQIAALCTLVEGTPLAIELAAAQSRDFSCKEIVEMVGHGMDFLTSSLHNIPARHRSIRALFDSSWALLSAEQREVARRLAIFRSIFDVESAVQVAGTTRTVLQELSSRSLLSRTSNGRYMYHALVRHYACEKLTAIPDEAADAEAAHRHHYAALLHRHDAGWYGKDVQQTVATLHAHIEDIRAAWHSAIQRQAWDTLAIAWPSLYFYYHQQGLYAEGSRLFEEAGSALADHARHHPLSPDERRLLADLLSRHARFLLYLGETDRAERGLQEALTTLDTGTPSLTLGFIKGCQGIADVMRGHAQQGKPLAEEALAIFEAVNDGWGRAFALNLMGNIAEKTGALDEAEADYLAALRYYDTIENDEYRGIVWNNLGNVAEAQADYALAKERYRHAAHYFEQIGASLGLAATLSNLGFVASQLGAYDEARHSLQASLAIKRKLNVKRSIAVTLGNLGEVHCAVGDYPTAATYYAEALHIFQEVADNRLLLDTLLGAATLLHHCDAPAAIGPVLAVIESHPATQPAIRQRASALSARLNGKAHGGALFEQSQSLEATVRSVLIQLQRLNATAQIYAA